MSHTRESYPQRKIDFAARLKDVSTKYKTCLLATADFVGSSQMQQIRKALRGKAIIVMGKKTLIRNVLRKAAADKPELNQLIPLIRGNVALIWTNDDAKSVRDIVAANKVPAAAKVGQTATVDVKIPAGPTSMDPGQTSFFQALNIATKISRGAIEILNEVTILKVGDKCEPSQVTLLQRLNLKPFSYCMIVKNVFDEGSVFGAEILDLTDEKLLTAFGQSVSRVAAICLRINYPTQASIPHIISNGFRKLVALTFVTGYEFEEAKKLKSAAAAAPAAAAASSSSAAAPAAAEAKKPEPEPEPEVDAGVGGLFD